VWCDRPPDSRPPGPLAQHSCIADQVLPVAARDFKGAQKEKVLRKVASTVG